MIVIVTHNGNQCLIDLLSDISKYEQNNNICIVDNKSTDINHLKFLKQKEDEGYNVLYNPKDNYVLGAYKYALENLKSDVWYFLLDSLRIKHDVFSYVRPLLTENNIYALITAHPGLYENQDVITYLLNKHINYSYNKMLTFNTFFSLDSVVRKVKDQWPLPTNKFEDMCTEIISSIIFDKNNIEIKSIYEFEPELSSDPNAYYFFYKIYRGRA